MTTEALHDFTRSLRTDPEMASGLVAAVGEKRGGDAAEAFAAYARERGYAVTREDTEAMVAAAQAGEGTLSDEQLDGVSGGFLHLVASPVMGAVSGAFDGAVKGAVTGAIGGVKRAIG